MNTEHFNRLCEKAFSPTSSMEDLNNLWQSVFHLDKWFFVSRGNLPDIKPYIAEANQIEPHSFWIYAFTNVELCMKFAKDNNLTMDTLGEISLSMPNNDGTLSYLTQLKNKGVKGIYFNNNAYGFYSPLEQLPIIKNHLINNGLYTEIKSKILGIRTVIYKVGDISVAKDWYTEAFGIQPYFDQPFYMGFEIGGYELGLQPEENPTKDKVESVITYWGVEDINMEFNRFLSLGATVHEKPQDVGEGIMTASLKDPWGNIIGLIYNPHFKVTL